MRAIVAAGDGTVRLETVPDPVVQDAEDAVVRVRRAAVCGTDLHVVGDRDHVPPGTVLGHEFAGEVVAAGAGVRSVTLGDLVAGGDYTACGRCWWCRRGDHWECEQRRFFGTGTAFGPALDGAQAEYVRVPYADQTLRPVPDGVGLDAAVLLGDTLATAYAAVQRAAYRPGDTIAVVGGGPVGQLVSLTAQACGAGPVLLVEPVAERRRLAEANGALTAAPDEAADRARTLTAGRGADAVVEAVGGARGLDLAFELVRARGTVVAVGVQADDRWPLPAARAFNAELTLRFAVGDHVRDAAAVGELVRAGAVDPAVLGADSVALHQVPDAYSRMAERLTLKALVVP